MVCKNKQLNETTISWATGDATREPDPNQQFPVTPRKLNQDTPRVHRQGTGASSPNLILAWTVEGQHFVCMLESYDLSFHHYINSISFIRHGNYDSHHPALMVQRSSKLEITEQALSRTIHRDGTTRCPAATGFGAGRHGAAQCGAAPVPLPTLKPACGGHVQGYLFGVPMHHASKAYNRNN